MNLYTIGFSKKTAEQFFNLLSDINNFISKQNIAYIRLGLSREYSSPDGRNGYWLQVNGIYTFPDYNKNIRKF